MSPRAGFANREGACLVSAMVEVIAANSRMLSEIDGLIGDGDHGVNMNKGFRLCAEQLDPAALDMSGAFSLLARVLMEEIGGSMGPLYGTMFRAFAAASRECAEITPEVFSRMLALAEERVRAIGECREGDKTMLDVLAPARRAFEEKTGSGRGFSEALEAMVSAAEAGRAATVDMVARKGRSSRLGERSRGVADAGATSCCLLLGALGAGIRRLLEEGADPPGKDLS